MYSQHSYQFWLALNLEVHCSPPSETHNRLCCIVIDAIRTIYANDTEARKKNLYDMEQPAFEI